MPSWSKKSIDSAKTTDELIKKIRKMRAKELDKSVIAEIAARLKAKRK